MVPTHSALAAPSRRVSGAGGCRRPQQRDGDARREACAGRCMKTSTSSMSSRGEKWRSHQISRPTSSLTPEYWSNAVWRCERPKPRRRRPVDALLPFGSFTSRSKLPVVYRRGLGAYSPGIASLLPVGPGPSFVGANRGCLPRKASTCARLINRVSRRRLQTGRSRIRVQRFLCE